LASFIPSFRATLSRSRSAISAPITRMCAGGGTARVRSRVSLTGRGSVGGREDRCAVTCDGRRPRRDSVVVRLGESLAGERTRSDVRTTIHRFTMKAARTRLIHETHFMPNGYEMRLRASDLLFTEQINEPQTNSCRTESLRTVRTPPSSARWRPRKLLARRCTCCTPFLQPTVLVSRG
jgi:hypothetical protein